VDVRIEVTRLLDDVLHLGGRAAVLNEDTVLMGGVPELDSMAVVNLISAFEDRFGFTIDDDEIDGAVFATLGSLTNFVASKLSSGT